MVREIPLTRGMVALVDDEDFDELAGFKWHAVPSRNTYAASRSYWDGGRIRHIFLHRQIMQAEPGRMVDHRDGNGLNNTRANLRIASRSQNGLNRIRNINKPTPFKGVFWHKSKQRYCVHFTRRGERTWGGWFNDMAEAARAYDDLIRDIDGEFATFNFPREGERGATP